MKKELSLKLVLLMAAALILPSMVLAQPTTITGVVANVVKLIWVVATGIVIVFWVITGVLFLSAMGAPEKLSTAKKSLFAAIAGTILVALAYSAGVIIENAVLFGV